MCVCVCVCMQFSYLHDSALLVCHDWGEGWWWLTGIGSGHRRYRCLLGTAQHTIRQNTRRLEHVKLHSLVLFARGVFRRLASRRSTNYLTRHGRSGETSHRDYSPCAASLEIFEFSELLHWASMNVVLLANNGAVKLQVEPWNNLLASLL